MTIQCPICLSDVRTSVQMHCCGTTIHQDCLLEWIDYHPFCPLCRRMVTRRHDPVQIGTTRCLSKRFCMAYIVLIIVVCM